MGFIQLLEVASMPVIQVLLISALGAFMATQYFNNLLSPDFRKSLNKVVFIVFTPSLVFASLAKSVSLQDMISWPNLKVEGLIIASCSSGNMGNLPIVIIPAICNEKGGPFGARDVCHSNALSYASFSMALGGIFIWTYTFQTIRSRSLKFKALEAAEILKAPNKDRVEYADTPLLKGKDDENTAIEVSPSSYIEDSESQIFFGFLFGAVAWLRNLIIGDNAPFSVIQDTLELLGNGTIPCITLLLGGKLTAGLKSSSVKPLTLISIIITRLFVLPVIGLFIVKAAANFGILPVDPLFQYTLVMQYAMPPAMNISTIAQLFDVGNEECSVILLRTYSAAAIALTAWSTFLSWLLSY
ncbi:auxin efflux carrier family protein [Medicago truncatula]|uniref:Auxin efflux carrier family protein n=1 Tax=Medicago truncatula TaxID=3880 RepID=G7K1B0_MEDTR|nr:auxin efflux carrier family protein [Medicago truncatula]